MIVRPSDILSIDIATLPDFLRDAIGFAKEWLDGRSSFVVPTSGSTGTPKQIGLHRDQMIASAKKTIEALQLKPGMTSLVCLDVKYIAGKMMIVRSLIAGMDMIIVEAKANPLIDVGDQPIDFAALVPYQLDHIFESPQRENLSSIGKIIIGGSSISNALLNDVQLLDAQCYATFGMTETLSHIALQKLNGTDKQDYFETLNGIGISTDERQCLVIRADYLPDIVNTNDIVELIDSRKFRWLGRWDTVINSGAVKIFPEKIEKIIIEYFNLRKIESAAFVFGAPHDKLGHQVVVVIEGLISEEQEGELMDHLRVTLARYEVPKQILYVNKFERTPTGKLDRRGSFKNALPRPAL